MNSNNNFKYLIISCILILYFGCKDSSRGDFNILINNLPVKSEVMIKPIDQKKYIGDFNLMIAKDWLPSGWRYDNETQFFSLKEFEFDENQYLIYAMTGREKTEILDFRIATIKNDTIIYNLPIGVNPMINDVYANIIINEDVKSVELYHQNKLKMIYLADKGIIEYSNLN